MGVRSPEAAVADHGLALGRPVCHDRVAHVTAPIAIPVIETQFLVRVAAIRLGGQMRRTEPAPYRSRPRWSTA